MTSSKKKQKNKQKEKNKPFVAPRRILQQDVENTLLLIGEINQYIALIDENFEQLANEIYESSEIAPIFLEVGENEKILNCASTKHEKKIMNLFDEIQKITSYVACQSNKLESLLNATIKPKQETNPTESTESTDSLTTESNSSNDSKNSNSITVI